MKVVARAVVVANIGSQFSVPYAVRDFSLSILSSNFNSLCLSFSLLYQRISETYPDVYVTNLFRNCYPDLAFYPWCSSGYHICTWLLHNDTQLPPYLFMNVICFFLIPCSSYLGTHFSQVIAPYPTAKYHTVVSLSC